MRSLHVEGSAGLGSLKRELKLRSHNKAVIGFRGLFSPMSEANSAIMDLWVYIGIRLDIITNSDQSEEPRRQSQRNERGSNSVNNR